MHSLALCVVLLAGRNRLANFNPLLQEHGRLASFQSGSCQLAALFNSIRESVDVASHAGIQDYGISLGIAMRTAFQDLLELFSILLGAAALKVNQFASGDTNRFGVKFKLLCFIHSGFTGWRRVLDLKQRSRKSNNRRRQRKGWFEHSFVETLATTTSFYHAQHH
jgi:hypothetical protein